MAMMARMRSLAPWFIVTVGGLFVLFMVLSDSKLSDIVGQRSNIVGNINGEDIQYTEFSQFVERARQNQVAQTGQEIPENQMDFFRDQVWDAMVTQRLIEDQITELGITVSDDDIKDALLGENPPEFLKQNFIDSTGNFNRDFYNQALFDPNNKQVLLQIEEQVRLQLRQQKLQDYLNASVTISEEEIKREFYDNAVKMNAEYLFIPLGTIPEALVPVTDDELQKYYNEHKETYKVEKQRKIKYVMFDKKASKGDSNSVKRNLEAIVSKVKLDPSTFKANVEIYSDVPYSKDTLSITSFDKKAADLLVNAKDNEVVGPVLTNSGYAVYKLNGKLRDVDTYAKASHILLKTGSDKDSTKAEAMKIYNRIRNGEDFATVAKEVSQDLANAPLGGDLGWFGKGQMVKEFEKAVFSGRIGQVQRPVETQFGFHIIKVTDKTNKKLVVEKIQNRIVASATTIDGLYNDASDFAYLADKNDFDKEAEILKYNVKESVPFLEDARAVPGIGANIALVKFAFEEGVGTVSDVFRLSNGYVVAMVTEKIPAGYKTFEEVKNSISNIVKREKKLAKTVEYAQEMKDKLGNETDLAEGLKLHPGTLNNKGTDFTRSSSLPGVGLDYALNDAAFEAELNKLTGPIKGSKGSYLVKVTYRTKLSDNAYETQRSGFAKELLANKRSSVFATWIQDLKKNADIEDKRYQFYR